MTQLGRAGLSISVSGKLISVKPAPTNQLVPFVSNANQLVLGVKCAGAVGEDVRLGGNATESQSRGLSPQQP